MREIESLVGVPFQYGGRGPKVFDCYGLIMEIHKQKGVSLPDYASPTEQGEIAAAMSTQLQLWEEVGQKQDTVALLRIGRFYSHVGYMVDSERMIHTWKSSGGVTIQRIDVWKHRVMGFYRYVG